MTDQPRPSTLAPDAVWPSRATPRARPVILRPGVTVTRAPVIDTRDVSPEVNAFTSLGDVARERARQATGSDEAAPGEPPDRAYLPEPPRPQRAARSSSSSSSSKGKKR